ncbi:DUF1851 domain-containing protein [Pedobacter sp. HMF7647]|uniref:DUF1851 domain-containing protein n=1 Tax=Hufsiella arboris TaxID=2695275 RepID=A0A7K1YFH7_9SPHI|nr:T6SS immunity protein Tdi1 domain-containing protein [Hufsiella arboris]MXV53353.1 DUF1851 domain-containing protein [Hufsiella arboris]
MQIRDYLKDKSTIDISDITEAWNWLIPEKSEILLVTCFGDLFLADHVGTIYWLDTSIGSLTNVAGDLDEFETKLNNADNFDNWFLVELFSELKAADIEICENEIYSYKTLPLFGGKYIIENIAPTNISVHFHLTGQICEQTKDLPDGTNIKIKVGE